VCENDALAIGAVDAIKHEFKLQIPDDIAVTGFDDIPQTSSPPYRLTTYRQPITRMAESLIEILKGNDVKGLDKFTGQIQSRDSA